jgi:hypothetical protein
MEHRAYWITGMFAGMGKYLLQINTSESLWLKIFSALVVAFLSGLAAAAGKYCFDVARKYIIKKITTK